MISIKEIKKFLIIIGFCFLIIISCSTVKEVTGNYRSDSLNTVRITPDQNGLYRVLLEGEYGRIVYNGRKVGETLECTSNSAATIILTFSQDGKYFISSYKEEKFFIIK